MPLPLSIALLALALWLVGRFAIDVYSLGYTIVYQRKASKLVGDLVGKLGTLPEEKINAPRDWSGLN